MYTQVRVHSQSPASSYVGLVASWESLMRVSREILFAYQASLLFFLSYTFPHFLSVTDLARLWSSLEVSFRQQHCPALKTTCPSLRPLCPVVDHFDPCLLPLGL